MGSRVGQVTTAQFLLDTNVVIGLVKGPGAARDLVDSNNAPPEICAISQITRIELLSFHALSPGEEARIKALLSVMTVMLLNDQIEQQAIALRIRTRLKLPDAIIGATAKVAGLQLLTLDQKLSEAFAG